MSNEHPAPLEDPVSSTSATGLNQVMFITGLTVGSTVGLVLGSLLTFWWGLAALRAFRRTMRRVQNGDQPIRELLMQ